MQPLSNGLPGALVELLRGSPLSDGKVTFAWKAAVGPAIERVTKVKLERRVLLVEAVSDQWSDRKSTRLNSSHGKLSRMPSSA